MGCCGRRTATLAIAAALCLPGLAWSGQVDVAMDDARALLVAGDLPAARDAYGALAARDDLTPAQASVVHNNACVALVRLGQAEDAVTACLAALDLRRSLGDDAGAAKTLSNLAWAERLLGNLDEAATHYAQALALSASEGMDESVAIVHGNLGILEQRRGRLTEALAHHGQAEAVARAHPEAPWSAQQLGTAVVNQVTVLEKLGRWTEALQRADDLSGEALTLPASLQATLALDRGTLYRNLEVPGEAVRLYEEAAAAFEALGDARGRGTALVNLGLVRLDNLEDPDGAEAPLRAAVDVFRAAHDDESGIIAAYHLGRTLTARGLLDEALAFHADGIAEAREHGSPEGRWTHAFGMALAHEAGGDLIAAAADCALALAALDELDGRVAQGEQTALFLVDKRGLLDTAVRVHVALDVVDPGAGHAQTALAVVHRAKARELVDLLGEAGGAVRGLDEIVARLNGAPLLELYVGATQTWAFVVDGGGVTAVTLGPSAPLRADAQAVRRAVSVGRAPADDLLERLGSALLAPLDADLPPRLWISADGPLWQVPFDALTVDGRWLGERTTILLAPSGAVAGTGSGGDVRQAGVRFTGVADPQSPPLRSDDPLARWRLAPLAHAVDEVQGAADRLGGDARLLLGTEATPDAVAVALDAGTDVLHLATHTVINDAPGAPAAILLAPDPDHPDGVISARQVAGLHAHTRLTVLASCRSGLQAARPGQGLASLTGAFLVAGSEAVVASLWDVDDAATAALMTQLYDGLAQGLRPAEALAQARRRLRATPGWESPYLWAGFVVFGDAGPVVTPRWAWWWWLVGGGLLGAVGVAVGVRRPR